MVKEKKKKNIELIAYNILHLTSSCGLKISFTISDTESCFITYILMRLIFLICMEGGPLKVEVTPTLSSLIIWYKSVY